VPDNRRRTWCPFRTGALVNLPAATAVRVDMTSIIEARLGRAMEGYTTQRTIFDYGIFPLVGTIGIVSCGIINVPSQLGAVAVLPSLDPTNDWLFWEEVMVPGVVENPDIIWRHHDVATVRKSPGRDRTTWFYLENSTAATAAFDIYIAGRMLILEG